jgi:hypothetical protein
VDVDDKKKLFTTAINGVRRVRGVRLSQPGPVLSRLVSDAMEEVGHVLDALMDWAAAEESPVLSDREALAVVHLGHLAMLYFKWISVIDRDQPVEDGGDLDSAVGFQEVAFLVLSKSAIHD